MAFERSLTAFRHAPWGGASGEQDMVRLDDDWSDAAFAMVFASDPGGAVIASMTLGNAAAGSQGISATYDAEIIHPKTGSVVGGTIIRPQIDQVTLEALNDPDPPSADIELYYTFYATPSGEPKRVVSHGPYIVQQGVEG